MRQFHHNATERKRKRLSAAEQGKIESMSQHDSSIARIAYELGHSYNFFAKHDLKCGMTGQIKHNRHAEIYFADPTGRR